MHLLWPSVPVCLGGNTDFTKEPSSISRLAGFQQVSRREHPTSEQGKSGGDTFPSSTEPQGNHEAHGGPWDLPPKRQPRDTEGKFSM